MDWNECVNLNYLSFFFEIMNLTQLKFPLKIPKHSEL